MIDLRGKNALITGSSRGVGQQLAQALAKLGCNVIVHGRTPESCTKTLGLLKKSGVKVYCVSGELSNEKQVNEVIQQVRDLKIQVDVLYNNAAVMTPYHTDYWGHNWDEWMLSMSGVSFLLSSTVFSLPLLLLPAWLIVGIGLRPLRSIANDIEQRSDADLTPLPDSQYRELSPLVSAINHLMLRLQHRIDNEREFLTDAAHELKTPLAAIQINAHLLLSRCAPDPTQRSTEAGQGLRDGVARATHMVHQLMALERARAEPSPDSLPLIDLGNIVRDRIASAAPLAMQRGIEIEFQAELACQYPVHLESMGALLDNLISNAIKYSPENGLVLVTLVPTELGCRLTLIDQGPGIDASLQQRVFERFYRIPGQEQLGSGLGLAIAERAAARNKGHISLANNVPVSGLIVTVNFLP